MSLMLNEKKTGGIHIGDKKVFSMRLGDQKIFPNYELTLDEKLDILFPDVENDCPSCTLNEKPNIHYINHENDYTGNEHPELTEEQRQFLENFATRLFSTGG